jgi:hypothetical protein
MNQQSDLPDRTKHLLGRENHAHYVLKPTIVTADASLRSLKPKQWVKFVVAEKLEQLN